MHKRIAVDLAKSVYQVAESVRVGQVSQRRRLNREAFRRYIQEQGEPVEWVMEACGTAHEVSGIGVLTASAFKAAVGQPERFANGRQLSAWLGMTPRKFSSGNSRKLGHISRQGNVYLRTLLIHGARSALLAAQRCQTNTPERMTALQRWATQTAARIGHNKAAVALANKLVRICWAVWCHERRFSGNWQSPAPA
nr:transposase [Pseudomonas taeanensis]